MCEGNGAAGQFQLDIFGELMDALHQARMHGIPPDPDAWEMQRELLDYLESNWREPDHGVWETRGAKRHFTHSKVMAWAALDRAVKDVEKFGLDGPVDRWKRVRAEIAEEACQRGYDPRRGTFTEYYGSRSLDAAPLALPNVGFLPSESRLVGNFPQALTHIALVNTALNLEGTTGPAHRRARRERVEPVSTGRPCRPSRRGRGCAGRCRSRGRPGSS